MPDTTTRATTPAHTHDRMKPRKRQAWPARAQVRLAAPAVLTVPAEATFVAVLLAAMGIGGS
ncbi:hypothetical protein [Streptomyces sp. NPDC048191]|uniref:hypothetical protein n=1 Tax=Streptomyces sp. NPDC048191 TaxID=3155484 RepID=UPI0033C5686B